jgi:hypothetical protein
MENGDIVARIRYLKPSFFDHEGLASISPHARLAFQGIWLHADREGRLKDEPKRMRIRIFPYEPELDMDAMIVEMESIGVIRRYEVDGVRYLFLPGFSEHQRPHPKEPNSSIPPCKNTAKHGETRLAVFCNGSIPPTTVGIGTGTGMENRDGDATKAKKTTARPLTARRNLNAEFEHPRFDVPTSWHLRHVKDISEGEAGMMAFYSWLSDRVDRTNEDTIVAGVEHGRFVWLDRCFAEWMLSTRKAPARLDTFAESQKRRQEELEANYDPRFEGLTVREKVELAKRLQAEGAGQS